VDLDERNALRGLALRWAPGAAGGIREASVCLYTNTPDGHFILDRHPAHREVVVASPCSGHGFKFAPAVGEILADLATDREPAFDISPFALRRFPV
jgi:glycine/D-amino acid oxidase-like deaminating enzyme